MKKPLDRIPIKKVDPSLKTFPGLFGGGCTSALCSDECCDLGCDVDAASLEIILQYSEVVEPLIKAAIEVCFATPLIKDNDYVGGAYRSTMVRDSDSRCAFHLHGGRGCALFSVWAKKGAPKEIVPTICRIYPATWHRGILFIDSPLREKCKCLETPPDNATLPSIFETQENEIVALFEIKEK